MLSGDYFFLEYAVLNWTHHVRRATEAAVAREQISEVIEPLQVFIGCWKNSSPTTAVSSHTQCRGRRLEFIPDDIYFAIMDYEKWNLTSNIGEIPS